MALGHKFFSLPPSIRIAIYYLAFASVWIIVSDQSLNEYQTEKGLAFVVVSAAGLGYFIHRAMQARERSERRFRAVVEHSGELISIVTQDGTQLYHSPAAQDLLGYKPEDLLGQGLLEFIHPGDRGMAGEFLESISASPRAVGWIELRVFHANGSMRNLHTTATNLLSDPSVGGIVLNTQDVTDQRLSEQQIARQLARLQALHEIDLAILGSQQLQETLDVVLGHIIDKLEVDAAAVLLYDRANQILAFAQGTGFHDDTIRHFDIPTGEGSAGSAMLSPRPRIITNVNESEDAHLRISLMGDEGFLGYATIPLIAKNETKGALELFTRTPMEVTEDWRIFANAIGAQTAIAIDTAQLLESLQLANEELEAVYDRTLEGWAAALELCDDETEGHSRRVVELTLRLARVLGLDGEEIIHIRRGALLHDIGKIGVPDTILLKPGRLDEHEWEIMQRHPTYAYDLLKPIPYLHPALDIPHYHHERWDGSGYPDGLSGEDIPLHARIFAVVDVYDALVSDRPYRKAWSHEDALRYIQEEAGKLFDPTVCAGFLALMQSLQSRAPAGESLSR